MRNVFVYVHLNTFKTDRGYKNKLRRSDGKIVVVSRKRVLQLSDQRRLYDSKDISHD